MDKTTQPIELGESSAPGGDGPVEIGDSRGEDAAGNSEDAKEQANPHCKDHEGPELCSHKNILCDDDAHKDTVRFRCAQTCGVCKELATNNACRDATPSCKANQNHCSLSHVK